MNLGCGHLCDDEFVAAFEACTISPAAFHHADHVRLAWIYAGRCDAKKAEERLLAGIRRFAAKAGVPLKSFNTQRQQPGRGSLRLPAKTQRRRTGLANGLPAIRNFSIAGFSTSTT
jgi:hypothetical protein